MLVIGLEAEASVEDDARPSARALVGLELGLWQKLVLEGYTQV